MYMKKKFNYNLYNISVNDSFSKFKPLVLNSKKIIHKNDLSNFLSLNKMPIKLKICESKDEMFSDFERIKVKSILYSKKFYCTLNIFFKYLKFEFAKSNVIENTPFNGLYCIWANEIPLYVGQGNLKNRIHEAMKHIDYNTFNNRTILEKLFVSFLIIKEEAFTLNNINYKKTLKDHEDDLIKDLDPLFNKAQVLSSIPDLDRIKKIASLYDYKLVKNKNRKVA